MTNIGDKRGNRPFIRESYSPKEEMLAVKKRKKKLLIGIPKEDIKQEQRVCLTPQAVDLLVSNGNKVLVEEGAGSGATFSSREYAEYGASVVKKEEVYKADIILKVAPLSLQEISLLKGKQLVMSDLLIYNQCKESLQALQKKKMSAISFGHIRDAYGYYPIVRSMSEIAGAVSISVASHYLSKPGNGKGVLLGGITGIAPTELVILGAGTVGEYAARAALGLGATVKVFDFSTYKLRRFTNNLGQKVFTSIFHPYTLVKNLRSADVVLGAFYFKDDGARMIVTEDMVRQMKPGSIIIDLNISNGGCFETSRMTTIKKPVYLKHDVIHHCLPNIPTYVPKTASIALSDICTPTLLELSMVGGDITSGISSDKGLRNGVYMLNGILTNRTLGERMGMSSQDINLLLAAFN